MDQHNFILDVYPGFLLAHVLGRFRFVSLRTPSGTTVKQGRDALRMLRTRLTKEFPSFAALALEPGEIETSLRHVSGSGWFATYGLEASEDYSPHYHLMLGAFGYDILDFQRAILSLWEDALSRVLGRPYRLRPRDVNFGHHLGPDTIRYLCERKQKANGHDPHDFSPALGEGQPLGTDWWHAWGGQCLHLVRQVGGTGTVVDVPTMELRERAIRLDEVRRNGREIPGFAAHFQDPTTEEHIYVVSGPWYGAAARYMVTGQEVHLAAYGRELRELRDARREHRAGKAAFPSHEASEEEDTDGSADSASSALLLPEVQGRGADVADPRTRRSSPSEEDVRRRSEKRCTRWNTAIGRLAWPVRACTARVTSWFISSGAAICRAVVQCARSTSRTGGTATAEPP